MFDTTNNEFNYNINAVSGTLRKSHPKSKICVREVKDYTCVFDEKKPRLVNNSAEIVILQIMLTGENKCLIEYVEKCNFGTADLVTKGILDIADSGRCLASMEDNIISVLDGVCVFADGSKIRIDKNKPAKINFIENYTNYVYFVKNTSTNKVMLYNSTVGAPTGYSEDNYVQIAEVSAAGVVSDKRTWATAKYSNYGGKNKTIEKTITITFPTGKTKGAYTYNEEIFDVGFGGFNYIRSEFQGDTYHSYIGDGEKVFFVDGLSAAAWVQKSGSSLIVTTGTWGQTGAQIKDVKMTLF